MINLVRWNPLHEVSLLQNQMNRLFEGALQGWPEADSRLNPNGWLPAVDIYETENDLVLTVDLPGVDPKQTAVQVENNVLTIQGSRQLDQNLKKENFHRVERTYGSFLRSFTLSTKVDSDKIQATYKDGVLNVTLPKAQHAKPKTIQIAAATA